ncbi:MAG: DUF493 domain-containing protein [Gammaproteobacteria bacterium]|nr:DUF493 domain-containing protein [Gammaproteobacteria bacterium]
MGLDQPDFRGQVEQIVTSHAGEAEATFRPSRDGKYVSISYTLRIESREQLDALYRELSTTDEVLFVL